MSGWWPTQLISSTKAETHRAKPIKANNPPARNQDALIATKSSAPRTYWANVARLHRWGEGIDQPEGNFSPVEDIPEVRSPVARSINGTSWGSP